MQLTKKEVVELIATEFDNSIWEDSQDVVLKILQALETNGILCLVEGEVIYNDLIQATNCVVDPEHTAWWAIEDGGSEYYAFPSIDLTNANGLIKDDVAKVIQRNSIPAYHCKSETQEVE